LKNGGAVGIQPEQGRRPQDKKWGGDEKFPKGVPGEG